MTRSLEEQREKMRERINKEIDGYFDSFESSSAQEDFDINRLECLMIENQRRVQTILNENSSELANKMEMSVKKTVRTVEKR